MHSMHSLGGCNTLIRRMQYAHWEDVTHSLGECNTLIGKTCTGAQPLFRADTYREFPDTQVRRLSADEVARYLVER